MTNPQNNSNLAPWKWALIGAGSTLVLALAGSELYNVLAQKKYSNSNLNYVANATPINYVNQQLLGQWQGRISGNYLTLIFTQEGKLFILNSPTSALQLDYQTNVTLQPKHRTIVLTII